MRQRSWLVLMTTSALLLLPVAHAQSPARPAAPTTSTGPPSTVEIESWLHAGRCSDAVVAITHRLQARPASATPAPRSERVTVAELALLAALACESPALTGLLTPSRLEPGDAGSYWYVHGVMAARQAWPGARAEPLEVARAAAARLEALAIDGRLSRTEVRRVSVLAAIAGAQEERDELTLLVGHASALDAQLREVDLADDRLLPVGELAGDLWLRLHRFEDALSYYRSVTQRHPGRTRAWIGRARAAREAGADAEAREAATRVLTAWGPRGGLDAVRAEMIDISTGRPRR